MSKVDVDQLRKLFERLGKSFSIDLGSYPAVRGKLGREGNVPVYDLRAALDDIDPATFQGSDLASELADLGSIAGKGSETLGNIIPSLAGKVDLDTLSGVAMPAATSAMGQEAVINALKRNLPGQLATSKAKGLAAGAGLGLPIGAGAMYGADKLNEKQAEYVEGFLNRLEERGFDKEAARGELFKDIIDSMQGGYESSGLQGALTGIGDYIADAAGSVGESAGPLISNVVDTTGAGADAAGDKITDLVTMLTKLLSSKGKA